MGILNISNDSFYDGGRYTSEKKILERCAQMMEEGAHIIDVGAQSTRPGASQVATADELDSIVRAIEAISKEFPDAVISVDTFHSSVAKAAIEEGAAIVNDVSGGALDEKMFEVVAGLHVPYVLMHMQGTPKNMQNDPKYSNVVSEVLCFFSDRLAVLNTLGVADVIIDPGFGFGKTVAHNYELLDGLRSLALLHRPILVGLSRKSMINKVLGTKPDEALNGTTAAHMLCLQNGASILRVHDVAEAVQAIKIHTFAQANMAK